MKVLLILIGFLSALSNAAETVHIGSGDWPPFLSESLQQYGLASAIVSEAFALEGIQVEYHFLPWKRNFESSKHGEYDGSLLWSEAPGRDEFFVFSDVLIIGHNAFFHRKDLVFDLDEPSTLVDLSVGILGSWEFPNTEGFGVVEVVTRTEQNIHKLARGRIDFFIEDRAAGAYLLGKHLTEKQASKFTFSGAEISTSFYRLMFSRKRHGDTDLVAKFNRGLARFKASGAHEVLCKTFERGKYYASCEFGSN